MCLWGDADENGNPIRQTGQGRAVCFPNGPTGEYMTEKYLQRITGLSAREIRDLIDELPTSGEVSA